MKSLRLLIRRFCIPQKGHLTKSILLNLIGAIFGTMSIMMLIPILGILFKTSEPVYSYAPFEWRHIVTFVKEYASYSVTMLTDRFGAITTLLIIGGYAVIGTALKTGFSFLAARELILLRNNVVKDLRTKIYNKIISLPIPFFTEEKKNDIVARMTTDVQEIELSILTSLDLLFQSPILIIVYIGAMIFMSWELTLFALIMLPIMAFLIGRVGKKLKRRSMEGMKKLSEILSKTEETLYGLRVIKAFNSEHRVERSFGVETDDYRKIQNRLMTRRALAHPMSEFLGTIVIVIVLWFGGMLILTGTGGIDAAAFIAYIAMFYSIINPAKNLTYAYYNIEKGMASIDRVDMILSAENTIVNSPNAVEVTSFEDAIEYKNVSFSYVSGMPVLKDVSLKIPKGSTIALVGQSGSGKSTFVDLLPRFYDIKDGAISIDNLNIKDIEVTHLRDLMGNVNQDPILFNDTIFNNITFGVDNATMEEVVEAAKIANAHEFILQTEHGYDTNIGDRGVKLSGGQRQRISIARAVLKNPPIMILDEATSALDTESEKLVQDALDRLMCNRTSIVVAHRLSTIKRADLICVFHEGEIVERGTHEELLAKNGIYTKLHEMQNL